MSGFFGDLIVPDIDPLEAAASLPVAEVRAALAGLREAAEQTGVGDRWEEAVLVGTDGSPHPPGPARGVLGVSRAWACLAGIGFWRDHYIRPRAPSVQAVAGGDFPLRSEFVDWIKETAAGGAAIRGPEVEALRLVATTSVADAPFRLTVVEDIEGTWVYEFDVAYRRRLAYALAFEASIRQGSLIPYIGQTQTLVVGSPSALDAVAPNADEPDAFSRLLNLVALLNRAVAYEAAEGAHHPDLPGRVVQPESKRGMLSNRLAAASAFRVADLTRDGRIALRALMTELDIQRQLGMLHVPRMPRWGTIAGSEAYSAPDDV